MTSPPDLKLIYPQDPQTISNRRVYVYIKNKLSFSCLICPTVCFQRKQRVKPALTLYTFGKHIIRSSRVCSSLIHYFVFFLVESFTSLNLPNWLRFHKLQAHLCKMINFLHYKSVDSSRTVLSELWTRICLHLLFPLPICVAASLISDIISQCTNITRQYRINSSTSLFFSWQLIRNYG